MSETDNQALVAQILSSYLSNNSVSPADLPSVIATVKQAFAGGADPFPSPAATEKAKSWQPAVPIKKSIAPDAVTCLCCGEKFKALKRHLNTEHQLTPEAYRAAFGLKPDHPIVAPSYTAKRSELAKSLGLGRKAGQKRGAAAKKPSARGAAAKKAAQ